MESPWLRWKCQRSGVLAAVGRSQRSKQWNARVLSDRGHIRIMFQFGRGRGCSFTFVRDANGESLLALGAEGIALADGAVRNSAPRAATAATGLLRVGHNEPACHGSRGQMSGDAPRAAWIISRVRGHYGS